MFQRLSSFMSSRNREQSQSEVKRRRLQELIDHICREQVEIISEDFKQRSYRGSFPYIFELNLKVRKASGTTQNLQWIVKALQENPKAAITTRYDVQTRMKKEMDICTFLIPAIDTYQQRVSTIDSFFSDLFPKFFARRINLIPNHVRPDRHSVIIYQNIEARGYKRENPCKGFDLHTAEMVVQNLGRLHAIPIAMRLKNMLQFKESVLFLLNEIPDGTDFEDEIKMIYDQMRYGLDNHPELEPHMEDIRTWIELSQRFTWMAKVYDTLDWFTLCHPRYSIRNIMVLRDDQKKPIHSKVFEPHRLEFNTGAKDLAYFMFTSIETETLRTNFDHIVHMYHLAFFKTLKEHNTENQHMQLFTHKLFLKEFNAMGPYMLADILYTLRTIICDNFNTRGEPLLTETYRQKFKDIVLLMIEKKWIRKIPTDAKPSVVVDSDTE